jgi:L-ribulose-5-phosphate 3-epimerase
MERVAKLPVGVYEKAFPSHLTWEERLRSAGEAGYAFVEMSIDESDERLSRLYWSGGQRAGLRRAIARTGIPILGMGLSAHRRFPLGSASSEIRQRSHELLRRAIELASDIGVRLIQIMGYDVFYEPRQADTEELVLEGLQKGVRWAASNGVMLGFENVDCVFASSVEKVMYYVGQMGSPWFQAYPDMGNLAASGFDPCSQLPFAKGHLAGVHVKDAVPGVYRGTPFGQGVVPFDAVFSMLANFGFWGPCTVEMWADLSGSVEPWSAAAQARSLVDQVIATAWAGSS